MEWSYSGACGPDKWCKLYSAAAGKNQSPIDISPNIDACIMNGHNSRKKIYLHYRPNNLNVVRNTGHSWQVNASNGSCEISGGPLNGTYELVQIHAHWGETDNAGSEHTVDGKKYSAELHLVHWNKTKYSNMEEAIKHQDGLCVLGVLLKLGDKNQEIQKIVEKIPDILHKGDAVDLESPLNPKLLLPKNLSYWTYMGSLTTPPCTECVVWVVFANPVEISHHQLAAFRSLRTHPASTCDGEICKDQILWNYRPTLPLGNRTINQCDFDEIILHN